MFWESTAVEVRAVLLQELPSKAPQLRAIWVGGVATEPKGQSFRRVQREAGRALQVTSLRFQHGLTVESTVRRFP